MIKIVSFSKLDQINRNTSPLLWFLNQSPLILFAPRSIISNWFDKNGKQTNPPWFNRGSNKSVARYNSRAKKSPSWRQFCPNHVHAQSGSKGRFCNATVARSRSAIVSPLYAYQFTSTCGPGSIALDLLSNPGYVRTRSGVFTRGPNRYICPVGKTLALDIAGSVWLDCFSRGTLFAGFESLNRATRGDKSREIGNPFCPLDRLGCVKVSVVDGEICWRVAKNGINTFNKSDSNVRVVKFLFYIILWPSIRMIAP